MMAKITKKCQHIRLAVFATHIFLTLAVISASEIQGQSFQGLGDLSGGDFDSRATGISGDGSVVVGYSLSSDVYPYVEAFRWTVDGGMVGLGDLVGGDTGSWARAVSDDGTVVVGLGSGANGYEAFLWEMGGPMFGLGDLPGSVFRSSASGVSGDGSIVVGASDVETEGVEAFIWTSTDGMQALGNHPGGSLERGANSVSADGSVIVGSSNADPFRWTSSGGLQYLPFLGRAISVSGDGSVVVGVLGTGGASDEAFRWTEEGGLEGLGDFPSNFFQSEAHDVSADGNVVVGWGSSENGQEAFIWTEADSMRSIKIVLEDEYGIDLAGWQLSEAKSVSADGTVIVGNGINPQGQTEGWRVTFPCTSVSSPSFTGNMKALTGLGESCSCAVSKWKDPVSGNFDDADLWTTDEYPVDDNCVTYDNDGIYNVTHSEDETTSTLSVGQDEVTLLLNNTTYTVYGPSSALILEPSLRVAANTGQIGRLTLDGGELLLQNAFADIGNSTGLAEITIKNGAVLDLPFTSGIFFEAAVDDDAAAIINVESGGKLVTGYISTFAGGTNSQASVEVTGSTSQWSSITTIFAEHGSATLDISADATTEINELRMAIEPGSTSDATLHSANFKTPFDGILSIGQGGAGTFEVSNGTSVVQEGSAITQVGVDTGGAGLLTIVGSTWISSGQLFTGVEGRGEVRIYNGSTVEFALFETSLFTGAPEDAPDNLIRVEGTGTSLKLTSGSFDNFVSRSGNGRLSILDNASLSIAGNLVVGGSPIDGSAPLGDTRGLFEVSGQDSEATIEGIFAIGDQSRGIVEVTEGANVWAFEIHVGFFGTAENVTNSLTVDGSASTVGTLSAFVGVDAPGVVSLTNGGTLVTQYLGLGNEGTINGDIIVVGGSPEPTGIQAGKKLANAIYSDTLLVSASAELNVASIDLQQKGVLGGAGSFDLPIVNNGTISPGTDSTFATMLFESGYQQSSGSLVIDIGQTESDAIEISGSATIGGTLVVRISSGYTSVVDQDFLIASADSIVGRFSNVVVESGPGDPAVVNLIYSQSSVTLVVGAFTVGVVDPESILSDSYVDQNYPNPFVGRTEIPFGIATPSRVAIRIFDILGREVYRADLGVLSPGKHIVPVDLPNESSGIYMADLQSTSGSGDVSRNVIRMILAR